MTADIYWIKEVPCGRRRQGRGPALWLSSLLVCSECGSNYVQYGRTDYVCSGFHSWLAEFTKERDAINRPTMPKPARISRSDFLQEYKSAVARKLKVFTSRENVAMSREALREVLAEGRVVLRPDVANARFEGSLVLSHEEFIEQKQIDIKLVAGAGFEPATFGL